MQAPGSPSRLDPVHIYQSTLNKPLLLSVDCHVYLDWPEPFTVIRRVSQIARLLLFDEFQIVPRPAPAFVPAGPWRKSPYPNEPTPQIK